MVILISFVDILPYIILVLAVVCILIFYVLWEKKRRLPVHDDGYYKDIIKALGELENIASAIIEHRRVQIELVSVDKVNVNILKTLEVSAFLTGKKITLLMNEQGNQLLDHIKSKRKEER